MIKQVSKWFLLIILSSSVFLSVIDIFIVNVAIPSIKKGLGGSDGDAQLVIVLYLLGYASFLITGGRLGDHFNKKKLFILSMLMFTLTSCMCGVSQLPWQLNASRFLQGISAGFMIPQGIAFIQVLFPDHKERIKALGIYGSIAGTASVIGQYLGGILPDLEFFIPGWRLIFLINLPFGLLFLLLAVRYLNNIPAVVKGRFDLSGVVLLTISLFLLIYPLVRGAELHWPVWSLLSIAVSFLSFAVFVTDQRKKLRQGKLPLLDVRLFAIKDFNIGLFAVLFYFMVQDTYFIINAVLFQEGLGISSSQTGIYFVFQGLGYVVASVISVRMIHRYGKWVLQTGVFIMVIALTFHLQYFGSGNEQFFEIPFILFLYGLGCGSVLPSLLTMALKSIPPTFAGVASGMFSTIQQTAIALGVSLTGSLFFYMLGSAMDLNSYLKAYKMATGINIALLGLVSFCLLLLPYERKTE